MNGIEYDKNIKYRGNAELDLNNLSQDYITLIDALANIHRNLIVYIKDNRVKIQMPSPKALELDGKKEIFSKHLGVDLTRHLVEHQPTCAKCFKYNINYDIYTLLNMPPLEQRGFPNIARNIIKGGNRQDVLVKDENGNLVPPQPGDTISISELPDDHFAIQYLKNRGFTNIKLLEEQFNTTYCFRENESIYWGKLPHDFKKTPQTRIIFNIYNNNIFCGWQGRLIDMVNTHNIRYLYHPYKFNWFPVSTIKDDKEILLPNIQPGISRMAKYIIGVGTQRNSTLMGFDTAKKYSSGSIIIVEGVLDAAKLGPPAVSVQGKNFSEAQTQLILNTLDKRGNRLFKHIVVIGDNDISGNNLVAETTQQFGKHGITVKEIKVPTPFKDVGEMTTQDAQLLIKNEI